MKGDCVWKNTVFEVSFDFWSIAMKRVLIREDHLILFFYLYLNKGELVSNILFIHQKDCDTIITEEDLLYRANKAISSEFFGLGINSLFKIISYDIMAPSEFSQLCNKKLTKSKNSQVKVSLNDNIFILFFYKDKDESFMFDEVYFRGDEIFSKNFVGSEEQFIKKLEKSSEKIFEKEQLKLQYYIILTDKEIQELKLLLGNVTRKNIILN